MGIDIQPVTTRRRAGHRRLLLQHHGYPHLAINHPHRKAPRHIALAADLDRIFARLQSDSRTIGWRIAGQAHLGINRLRLNGQGIQSLAQGYIQGGVAILDTHRPGMGHIARMGHLDLVFTGTELHARLIGQRHIQQPHPGIGRLGAHGQGKGARRLRRRNDH